MKLVPHLAILAALAAPAACATRGPAPSVEPVGQTPTPAAAPAAAHTHEHAASQPHELPATAGPGYTIADVRFMQNMIGHHAQAITMAALVPTHGAADPLRRLAEKIDISQRDEIDMMKRWLGERGQAIPDDGHAHAMPMPGMLTEEQMARLQSARGLEFERLFLAYMIQHHEGALVMVEELFASPGAAQDSEVFRFATDVDADQRDEIYVMQGMLDMLDSPRGSRSR